MMQALQPALWSGRGTHHQNGDSQTEAQFRLLATALEAAASPSLITNRQGEIVWTNSALCTLSGYSPDELLGKNPRIFKSGLMDSSVYTSLWQTILAGEIWRGEFTNRRKDGELWFVEHTVTPIFSEEGAITHFIAIYTDQTERKRSEDALLISREYARHIIRSSLDMIIAVDRNRRIIEFNEAAQETFGYACHEVLGKPVDLLYADPSEGWAIHEMIALNGRCVREVRNRRKNGEHFTALLTASELRNGRNEFMGVMGISRDITEQLRQRDERDKLSRQLQSLLESTGEGICGIDSQKHCIFINRAGARMLGYEPAELLGKPFHELVHPAAGDCSAQGGGCALGATLLTEQPFESDNQLFRRRDGNAFPVQCSSHPVREHDSVTGAVIVFADITEKKRIEQELLRNQRLESIGTLAGGIAHDLNNVLAPILMSIEILRCSHSDPATQRVLSTLESSARRGADMVKQILTFARGVEGKRVVLHLPHLIKELCKILTQTFPRTIEISALTPEDLWSISGDATQLHQVLMNLCVNARDAMPNGGRLTLQAQNLLADHTYASMHRECRVGPYVVVSVRDAGTGIPESIRARIFEPFFSTKNSGAGTGLGLATVRNIVKSHGGFVTVQSEIHRGTEFKVYLPAEQAPGPGSAEVDKKVLPLGNGELLLVVDDEAAVLDIAKQTLQTFGYRVLTASNGAEAVALSAEHGAELKLLLTDIAMPIMDGIATIQAVRTLRHDLKIVAATGLGSGGKRSQIDELAIDGFLQKPYTAETLLKSVQSALGKT